MEVIIEERREMQRLMAALASTRNEEGEVYFGNSINVDLFVDFVDFVDFVERRCLWRGRTRRQLLVRVVR